MALHLYSSEYNIPDNIIFVKYNDNYSDLHTILEDNEYVKLVLTDVERGDNAIDCLLNFHAGHAVLRRYILGEDAPDTIAEVYLDGVQVSDLCELQERLKEALCEVI